jgi:hypothetical protein
LILALAVIMLFALSACSGSDDDVATAKSACTSVTDTWAVETVDDNPANDVTTVSGDLNGKVTVTGFVPGEMNGAWLDFTGSQILHEAGGDIHANILGKINVETNEIRFQATYVSGEGDWVGVVGGELVEGVNRVGGTSHGHVCT